MHCQSLSGALAAAARSARRAAAAGGAWRPLLRSGPARPPRATAPIARSSSADRPGSRASAQSPLDALALVSRSARAVAAAGARGAPPRLLLGSSLARLSRPRTADPARDRDHRVVVQCPPSALAAASRSARRVAPAGARGGRRSVECSRPVASLGSVAPPTHPRGCRSSGRRAAPVGCPRSSTVQHSRSGGRRAPRQPSRSASIPRPSSALARPRRRDSPPVRRPGPRPPRSRCSIAQRSRSGGCWWQCGRCSGPDAPPRGRRCLRPAAARRDSTDRCPYIDAAPSGALTGALCSARRVAPACARARRHARCHGSSLARPSRAAAR